jgi:hypothetical protein
MAPQNFLYEAHLQEQKKLQVWAKGRVIPGYNPDHWRWDAFRTPIKYTDYGNQSSPNGWQFDHYPSPSRSGVLTMLAIFGRFTMPPTPVSAVCSVASSASSRATET